VTGKRDQRKQEELVRKKRRKEERIIGGGFKGLFEKESKKIVIVW